MSQTLYLAPAGFFAELSAELSDVIAVRPPLVLAAGPPQPTAWALDVWYDPAVLSIKSISDGVRQLKRLGRFWSLLSIGHHRRAALVQEQLRCPAISPIAFPDRPDIPQIGGWTLWQPSTILVATRRWKRWPHGRIEFIPDRLAPPNRAYLKLWEALTLIGDAPGPGDLCLDLGASPGGWTWVLQRLGAEVIAVDKAPLAPKIARLPRVRTLRQSAFALEPGDLDSRESGPNDRCEPLKIDWLFSDVICYPERLLRLVQRWRDSGCVKNIVATVKFQGPTDTKIIDKFKCIENSNLIHLMNNKHELTWIWPRRPNLAVTS